MRAAPDFDPIARPYRCFEYLTLGRALERCRLHYLPQLTDRREALVLGDGDGRFLARLLARNPQLHADAVDTSAAMLQLLRRRCEIASADTTLRLHTHHASALSFIPTKHYDLVVTHFFLDCLTQQELESLIARLAPTLAPNAIWLLSDFRIPSGPLRLPARIFIRCLYFAFRLLTRLRTTQLPDHKLAFACARFTEISHHRSLFGMLTTELWQAPATK